MAKVTKSLPDVVEPVDATIVADKRYRLGRRLAILAVGLLLMFFAISSYIQAARNGAQLDQVLKNNTKLVDSLDSQARLIGQLQEAIRRQNQVLKDAGLKTVDIPVSGTPTTPQPTPSTRPRPTPTAGPKPSSRPNPRPSSNPRPRPTPKPTPSPSPSPLVPVDELVCQLTGICL